MTIEIGITTFADVALEGGLTPAQRIPQLLDEIALADQVGLDVMASASTTAEATQQQHPS